MASIQSLGIGSGLLTNELADDIIAAEREPIEARLDNEQTLVEARISAYGEISSAVSSFSASLQSLTLPTSFSASDASSSSEHLVSATASAVASAGTYQVEVDSLAQNHSLASRAYDELDDIVGSGNLTFRFGTIDFGQDQSYLGFEVNPDSVTKSLTIDSSNNTLAGIRDAINEADFGVQATIVDDGSGFRLLFSTTEGGVSNSMEIVATGDAGLQALNHNLTSQAAAADVITAQGSLDLSAGAGLDIASRAFSIDYKGTLLNVVIPSDGAINSTATAVAAIQNALDAQLSASGFNAGDVIANGTDDLLSFSTASNAIGESLEVISDGSSANIEGTNTLSNGFDFSANNASFSIAINGAAAQAIVIDGNALSREDTVQLVNQALVNAGLGADVEATLNANNELVFATIATGTASSIAISNVDAVGTAASSQLGLSVASANGLNGFGLDTNEGAVTGSAGLTQTIAAQDANLQVNGLSVTRGSNLVTGVIGGTTLNLKALTSGPVTISVAKDPDAIVEKIQGFVEAYNGLKTLYDELTAFVPDAGANGQGSILMGDSTLRSVVSRIDSMLRSTINSGSGSIRSFAQIGITTDQHNDFQLTFDSATFQNKFSTNSEDIVALFANAGSGSDAQLKYVSSSSSTQAGNYDVEITRLATIGTYTGLAVDDLSSGNIVIDDNNDEFRIRLNGIEASVQLIQGTYATAVELGQQIQQQINSASIYSAGNHSATVTYNSESKNFEFSSNIYGSTSNIEILSGDSNIADTMGIIVSGQGPFEANQLGGLATASGLSSDPFDNPLVINADTSFEILINGATSSVLTLPGDSGSPQTYNSADDVIAALEAQINADPAFNPQAASTTAGSSISAGEDFSAANRIFSLSVDGGVSEVAVTVDGDAATVSFGGQIPGTIENSLAAIQAAIDATALNGQVSAELDGANRIVFSTSAVGSENTIQVTSEGSSAQLTGNAALAAAGFDFAGSNAQFDIAVDGDAAVSITIDQVSTDEADTVSKVQDALDAAGVGDRVTASLDGSNQLVLSRAPDTGTATEIAISNINATAGSELQLAISTVSGEDGFSIGNDEFAGQDRLATIEISYDYDTETQLGRFVFNSDANGDSIEFADVSANAASALGLFVGDGSVESSKAGFDVAGKINGIEAIGTGQFLRAADGNVAARPGFYLNQPHGNLASSSSNDKFSIKVDGVTSSAITLGAISNANSQIVASALQSAINANPAIQAGGVSVKVEFDVATGGFGIISNSTGRFSSVEITDLQGSAGGIFGFSLGKGLGGAIGTEAQGSPDPASGIKIEVAGGEIGPRGSVSFVRGIADQLDSLLDSFLGSNGLITSRTAALNDQLAGIGEERTELNARLESSEERLRASFLANDLIISSLNSTADFLTSQLSLLEGIVGGKKDK